jgi:hypothetical protein
MFGCSRRLGLIATALAVAGCGVGVGLPLPSDVGRSDAPALSASASAPSEQPPEQPSDGGAERPKPVTSLPSWVRSRRSAPEEADPQPAPDDEAGPDSAQAAPSDEETDPAQRAPSDDGSDLDGVAADAQGQTRPQ